MALDEQLLAKQDSVGSSQEDYNSRVSEFNASKQADWQESETEEEEELDAESEEGEVESDLELPVAPKGNPATNRLLRQAWINLIPSWGLTLIWINIHVILSMVFGKAAFCKLGDEWLGGAAIGKKNISGSRLNLLEKIGLALLDLGCLVILIGFSIIAIIVANYLSFNLEFIINTLGTLWDAIISIFK
ncbi:MAG: hypothetical protein ACOX0C_01330 [Patescibacteria group bacterium]|jgi:hypothetical protein